MSIQNRIKFKKPVIHDDGGGFGGDDDADELGDELEGNADVADMMHEQDDEGVDDDIDDFDFGGQMAGGGQAVNEEDMLQQQIIHSQISREEWLLECERVTARLKVNKVTGDGKEWRAHMDQTKKLHEDVRSTLPDVRYKLERLAEDVSKNLEKISKKESQLTRSFQG